jgi:Flp pilus assembly protein TadD
MRYDKRFLLSALIVLAALVLSGCATKGGQPQLSRESEYQKMLQLQKQRADVSAREAESRALPEMTAEDHDRMGDRYVRQDNKLLALIEYRKALALKPGMTITRYKAAQLLLSGSLTDQAMKEFDYIAGEQPQNDLAYVGKGMVWFRKGDLKQATDQFERALAINPQSWQAHQLLGLAYDRQEQFLQAKKHYQAGLGINGASASLHNNLGMSYYLQGEYASSAEEYLRALQIDPANYRVYNNLGLALAGMGRYREAFEAFRRGRDEATAYNNLGYIYLTQQKYGEAAEALQKAIDLKPVFYTQAEENLQRARAEARVPE